MGIMSAHMKKQQKISEERAVKLRQMRDDFQSTRGLLGCTPEDRNNPGKPRCFCFTADNQANPQRASSQICQNSLARIGAGGEKSGESLKSCVDVNFGLDRSCSCRDRKGPDGKNTCLKAGAGLNVKGMSPGMFRMLGAGMGAANNIFSGNMGAADLDVGSIDSNVAKIKKMTEEIVGKNNPAALKEAKKYEKEMSESLVASGANLRMPGIEDAMNSLPANPQEAVAKLQEEFKDEQVPEVTAAQAPSSGEGVSEEKLEFGLSESQAIKQEAEIAEVMKENLEMGNNDVNTSSTTNIFEVLSVRYRKSAMRRLFDEEGKTVQDAPAKTDIAE